MPRSGLGPTWPPPLRRQLSNQSRACPRRRRTRPDGSPGQGRRQQPPSPRRPEPSRKYGQPQLGEQLDDQNESQHRESKGSGHHQALDRVGKLTDLVEHAVLSFLALAFTRNSDYLEESINRATGMPDE